MRWIHGFWLILVGGVFAFVLHAGPAGTTAEGPQYAPDGKMLRPVGYREWIYLSSGLGMNYGPVAGDHPMFTNVFVNPPAYRHFLQTGKWPDKTVFALEIYTPATHGSINKAGHYQESFMALESAVKDESKGENTWAYYGFNYDSPTAQAFPKEACWQCHNQNGAVENSFVQFYPQLLDVALAQGTVKPTVDIPPGVERTYKNVLAQGWAKTAPALQEARRKYPDAAVFEEGNLNMMGYGLVQAKRTEDAIGVFQWTAEQFPQSPNAFDSLADAYTAAKRRDQAIAATKHELTLLEGASGLSQDQRNRLKNAAEDRLKELNKTN